MEKITPIPEQKKRNKKIYDLFKNGMSQTEIGAQFGVTRSRINKIIKKYRDTDIVDNVDKDKK